VAEGETGNRRRHVRSGIWSLRRIGWARETVEAEAYSRRLGKRIREGYAAKFRRLSLPYEAAGGSFPNTAKRSADSARLLMPFSIRRSMAKSPGSISMKLKNARPGVSHR
jgi:uncharacterized protein (DUF2132 family)